MSNEKLVIKREQREQRQQGFFLIAEFRCCPFRLFRLFPPYRPNRPIRPIRPILPIPPLSSRSSRVLFRSSFSFVRSLPMRKNAHCSQSVLKFY